MTATESSRHCLQLSQSGVFVDQLDHRVTDRGHAFWCRYVHRVGRTGRAGHSGTALTLLTAEDKQMHAQLQSLLAGRALLAPANEH